MFVKKFALISVAALAFNAAAGFAESDKSKLNITNEYSGEIELVFIPEASKIKSKLKKDKLHNTFVKLNPAGQDGDKKEGFELSKDDLGGKMTYHLEAKGKLIPDGTLRNDKWKESLVIGTDYTIVIQDATTGPKIVVEKAQSQD